MRMTFRSFSGRPDLGERERERLEARCEELKFQTGNRPTTLATMKKHQLVEAAVTELFWSRDRAERETVGQLRLALRNSATRRKNFSPGGRIYCHSAGRDSESKRSKNWLQTGTSPPLVQDALIRDLLRWCERQPETGTGRSEHVRRTCRRPAQSRVNSLERRLETEEDVFMTLTGRRR